MLFLVCVAMLAGGIFLAPWTEMMGRSPAPGQSWKLVLGTMIASFAGFGLIGVLIYATPPGAMKGMGNPPAALQSGQRRKTSMLFLHLLPVATTRGRC